MNIDLSNTCPDDFCDCCHAPLTLCRTYYNGRAICPACYGKEIDKKILNYQLGWECPKCHKIHNPLILMCDCNSPDVGPFFIGDDPTKETKIT